MRIIFGAPVFALVLFIGPASLRGAEPLTLQQAINQALKHSPAIEAARHQVEAARFGVTRKKGTTLPYLSSDLRAYEVNGEPVTLWDSLSVNVAENGPARRRGIPFPSVHWSPVTTEEISLDYPLFRYGSILGLNDPPVVAAARFTLTEQEWTALLAAQKVILDAATAFSEAVWYQHQLETNRSILTAARQMFEIVQTQTALGLKLPQDTELARAQMEAAQRAVDSSRETLGAAKVGLAVTLGLSPDDSDALRLDRATPATPALEPLPRLLNKVIPIHPAMHIQQARIDIAQQQYLVDKNSILPTADFNTSFAGGQDLDYATGSGFHRRPTAFISYLKIDIPLYDFGQRRAATDESRERVLSEKANLRQVELTLRTAITQTYSQIVELNERIGALQAQLVRARNAANLVRAQHSEGIVDQLKLDNAEVARLTAEINLGNVVLIKQLKYAELQDLTGGTFHWPQ